MSTGNDLAQRHGEIAVNAFDVDAEWTARQKALILRTVAKGASPEELHLFLGTAKQHNLNPLTGEIWCVKTRGRNGDEGRIAIIVGEQGRLKIANRHEDYRGYRSDYVCENDVFIVEDTPHKLPGTEDTYSYVRHSYQGSRVKRGAIVGAWCEVYRVGRPATYFFAERDEYFPFDASDKAQKFIPWFKTEGRMIQKCAVSTGFRMAFNLSGLYGEEEMHHRVAAASSGSGGSEDLIEWGETEETADRMRSLFAACNNAVPGAYTDAKIGVMLGGLSDEERYALAARELIPFVEQHGGTVPEPGENVVPDGDVEIMHDPDDREPAAEQETLAGT